MTTACKRVEEVAVSDYKDTAMRIYSEIRNVLLLHPSLESLFEDMPDGGSCPRSFLEWASAINMA